MNLFARKLAEIAGVTMLEEVKIVHLRQFIQHMMTTQASANNPRRPTEEKLLSPFTVRGYVRALKVFFSWCYQEDLIESNPSLQLVP